MKTQFNNGDHAVLVYPAGIANVFKVSGKANTRIAQADFRTCEVFFRGIMAGAGIGVRFFVAWCNKAGDIANQPWNYSNLDEAPFSESFGFRQGGEVVGS